MAFNDVELLARTVQCEAGGEGYNGMQAVATVIMNRVHISYGEYSRLGGSLRNVLYQRGQFDCLRETIGGRQNLQNIYNMRPEQEHIDIAIWALEGNKLANVAYSLWYYNPYSAGCRGNFPSNVGYFNIRIGNHCFYNPTEAYQNT